MINDLDGKIFGDLKVIGDTGKRNNGRQRIMLCQRISDGKFLEFNATSLKNGSATGFTGSKKSSEKFKKTRNSMKKDIVGSIFGNLKVIRDLGMIDNAHKVIVKNINSGYTKKVRYQSLVEGKSLGIDRHKIMPKRTKRRSSSIQGVGYRKDTGKWRAYIGNKNLGTFLTKQEAIAARKTAEQKYFN
ncbi:hypothetical protein [Lactiplantibacillus plantarum]|uniref:hypothetical protein n=1 Tax=Lactiplantibacillus plantarum TaxID=1590 RepID=UPI003F53E32F